MGTTDFQAWCVGTPGWCDLGPDVSVASGGTAARAGRSDCQEIWTRDLPFEAGLGSRRKLLYAGWVDCRGRSSVVERQLPKLYVVGSIPIARSRFPKRDDRLQLSRRSGVRGRSGSAAQRSENATSTPR